MGRKQGVPYLRIVDDGDGIPRDAEGIPNFKYVATHICDSIKRQLKKEGASNLQGEFGIGLLGFWTVGEELRLISTSTDGKSYEMVMQKGSPGYRIGRRRLLIASGGTELTISPLLPGVRHLNGEKIQRYLASELRDRIRRSGVRIRVVDRTARKEMIVEPREFSGRLLHQLPEIPSPSGEIYHGIYLSESSNENRVGLYRAGTRVCPSLADLEPFNREPWNTGWLEGMIDVPFLNLTPGTRSGVIQDERFAAFCEALKPMEEMLSGIIAEQRRAEEKRASRKILKTVQNALREAILSLPQEEYDWFDIHTRTRRGKGPGRPEGAEEEPVEGAAPGEEKKPLQKEFFDFAGPLFSVRIFPSSAVVAVGKERGFRAMPRDKSRRLVEEGLAFAWRIDGVNFHMRLKGSVELVPVPVAIGVTEDGHKKVLSMQAGDKESAFRMVPDYFKVIRDEPRKNRSGDLLLISQDISSTGDSGGHLRREDFLPAVTIQIIENQVRQIPPEIGGGKAFPVL